MLHITQELVFCLWLLLSVAYYTRLGLLTASSALIRVSSPTRPWLHILLEVIKHAAKKGKNSPKGCARSVKCNIHALSLWLKTSFFFSNIFWKKGKEEDRTLDRTQNWTNSISFNFPACARGWQISHGVGFPHSPHGHMMPRVPLHPWMRCAKVRKDKDEVQDKNKDTVHTVSWCPVVLSILECIAQKREL